MVSISSLKRDPKILNGLGNREREILFAPDAKVRIDNDFPPRGTFATVKSKREGSFTIAIKSSPGREKGTVVN